MALAISWSAHLLPLASSRVGHANIPRLGNIAYPISKRWGGCTDWSGNVLENPGENHRKETFLALVFLPSHTEVKLLNPGQRLDPRPKTPSIRSRRVNVEQTKQPGWRIAVARVGLWF
ncbi:hypothetical protein GQ53DRAFT_28430 [Thozetella sp. PMI_491]|nr:hypothetical protein GQ53DRAFT_28430 [Thozetella sp. PMI_491]